MPPSRIRYRLPHFAVDATSGLAGSLYPGMSSEWVAMASKESSLAAAPARVWAIAAIREYQEKYRSRDAGNTGANASILSYQVQATI